MLHFRRPTPFSPPRETPHPSISNSIPFLQQLDRTHRLYCYVTSLARPRRHIGWLRACRHKGHVAATPRWGIVIRLGPIPSQTGLSNVWSEWFPGDSTSPLRFLIIGKREWRMHCLRWPRNIVACWLLSLVRGSVNGKMLTSDIQACL